MADVRGQQLAAMRKIFGFPVPAAAASAYEWIKANAKEFKGRVVGPLVLELKVGRCLPRINGIALYHVFFLSSCRSQIMPLPT